MHTLISVFGADPKATTLHGDMPIHLAAMNGHQDVVTALVNVFGCNGNERGQNQWAPLHCACYKGDVGMLHTLISQCGADPNATSIHGDMPIHLAAMNGHQDIVTTLVNVCGCNVNKHGHNQWTPLHYACSKGHPAMMHTLISELGAHPKATNSDGDMPVHLAAMNGHQDIVTVLVNIFRFDVNEPGENQWTLLHYACLEGYTAMVHTLISKFGADPKATTAHGDMSIHLAAMNGHHDVVTSLVDIFGCNVDERGQNQWTPLHYACEKGHPDMVHALISKFGADCTAATIHGVMPIHIAASNGHQSIVTSLVNDLGSDISERGQNQWTPLHYACSRGHTAMVNILISEFGADHKATTLHGNMPIHLAAMNGHRDVVTSLINVFGCNVNQRGQNQWTPFHCACYIGDAAMMHTLMSEFGAEPKATTVHGDMPIHLAAMNGHQDIVTSLINVLGCNVNEEGWNQWTPLHCACYKGDAAMVHALLSKFGAELKATTTHGDMPVHLAAVNGHQDVLKSLVHVFGCSVHERGQNQCTPLHYACSRGHTAMVNTLISEFGADHKATTLHQDMPIHLAATNDNQDTVTLLIDVFGCNVDERGQNQWTPLHYASSEGHITLVHMLISEFGANPNATTLHGDMPIHLAAMNGHHDVVTSLVNAYEYNVDERGQNQWTPLHYASSEGHTTMVHMLISEFGANPNATTLHGDMPIHLAAMNGHHDVVTSLVNAYECNVDERGQDQWTPLHYACFEGHTTIMNTLISELGADPKATTECGDYVMPIHLAAMSGHQDIVEALILDYNTDANPETIYGYTPVFLPGNTGVLHELIKLGANIHHTSRYGEMPIHNLAAIGRADLVSALVCEFGCPVDLASPKRGLTALHFACSNGQTDMIEELIVNLNANRFIRDASQNTPINLAAINGHTDALRVLVRKFSIDPETKGSNGRTPLLHVCSKGNRHLLKILHSEFGCSIDSVDDDGNTALHIAALHGHDELARELIVEYRCDKNAINLKKQTPIHLALENNRSSTVRMLVSEVNCDPNCLDADEMSVLHYAARIRNPQILTYLLQTPQCSAITISTRDRHGYTPLHYAIQNQHTFVVSELVKHNCKPSTIEKEYAQLELSSKRKLSEGSLTKVFVIGNKGVGKSTLVEALRNETIQDPSFSLRVVPNTSGIVPSIHESAHYGKVLLYDFAGDAEYYSSHAAALERLLTSSCNIFIIVFNLSGSREELSRILGYWLTFVSYNSKNYQSKAQVIMVGSHADIIRLRHEDPDEKLLHLFTEITSELQLQCAEMVGYCAMNCKELQSPGMSKLYMFLEHCSIQSRREGKMQYVSEAASILLGVLERDFSNQFACQVSRIRTHIETNNIYVPLEEHEVHSYLQELNSHGVILILGNREGLNEEWVILNISAFLSNVHKQIFSPTSLDSICSRRAISNLGIIPESGLNNVLPDYDQQLLVQCLKHLQYCIQLDDSQTLSLLQSSGSPTTGSDTELCIPAKLLFFPALLKPDSSPGFQSKQSLCKGWYMECSEEYSYFPPRFLHVLLLRLAFNFALPPPRTRRESSTYSRRCNLFKNAIQWMTDNSVECVVEVAHQNKAVMVAVMSGEDSEVEAATVLVSVVNTVLEARQDFCHSLKADVFLIDPDYIKSHPLSAVDDQSLYCLSEVRDVLQTTSKRAVVSVAGGRTLSPGHLWTHTMWNLIFPLTTLEVLKSIEPVVGQWYILGLQLGLKDSTLEAIEHDHRQDVQTCKRRMIREWLKKPHATWQSLVQALREAREETVATRIEEEHMNLISIQDSILSEASADQEITEDFTGKFCEMIGSRWSLLASLLSFTAAEIEDIKKGVTGLPSVKAAAMLKRWREKTSPKLTYGYLKSKLLSALEDQLSIGHEQT